MCLSEGSSRVEWEYKVIQIDASPVGGVAPVMERTLNELGREGWELVAVWGYPFVLFLKRPVRVELTVGRLEQTEAEQFAQVVLGMG